VITSHGSRALPFVHLKEVRQTEAMRRRSRFASSVTSTSQGIEIAQPTCRRRMGVAEFRRKAAGFLKA